MPRSRLQPFVLEQVLDEMSKPSADIIEGLVVRQMHFLVLQRFIRKNDWREIIKGLKQGPTHGRSPPRAAATAPRIEDWPQKEFLREILKEARARGSEVKLTDRLPVTVRTPQSESKNPRTGEFFTMCRLVEAGGIKRFL